MSKQPHKIEYFALSVQLVQFLRIHLNKTSLRIDNLSTTSACGCCSNPGSVKTINSSLQGNFKDTQHVSYRTVMRIDKPGDRNRNSQSPATSFRQSHEYAEARSGWVSYPRLIPTPCRVDARFTQEQEQSAMIGKMYSKLKALDDIGKESQALTTEASRSAQSYLSIALTFKLLACPFCHPILT
jgi:hypothetical protein